MAYGTRYKILFTNTNGIACEVRILRKDYSGAVELLRGRHGAEFVVSVNFGNTGELEHLATAEASISFYPTPLVNLNTFKTLDPERWRVELYIGSVLEYKMKILTQDARQAMNYNKSEAVVLRASDGLGLLKDKYLYEIETEETVWTNTETYFELMQTADPNTPENPNLWFKEVVSAKIEYKSDLSISKLLCLLLAKTNLELGFEAVFMVYNEKMGGGDGMPSAPTSIEQFTVNAQLFKDTSVYDSLQMICKTLGAVLFQRKGKWRLVRVNDYARNTIEVGSYNTATGNYEDLTTVVDTSQEVAKASNNTKAYFIENNHSTFYFEAYKSIKSVCEYKTGKNRIPNNFKLNFSDLVGELGNAYEWRVNPNNTSYPVSTNYQKCFRPENGLYSLQIFAGHYGALKTPSVPVLKGQTCEFYFKFRNVKSGGVKPSGTGDYNDPHFSAIEFMPRYVGGYGSYIDIYSFYAPSSGAGALDVTLTNLSITGFILNGFEINANTNPDIFNEDTNGVFEYKAKSTVTFPFDGFIDMLIQPVVNSYNSVDCYLELFDLQIKVNSVETVDFKGESCKIENKTGANLIPSDIDIAFIDDPRSYLLHSLTVLDFGLGGGSYWFRKGYIEQKSLFELVTQGYYNLRMHEFMCVEGSFYLRNNFTIQDRTHIQQIPNVNFLFWQGEWNVGLCRIDGMFMPIMDKDTDVTVLFSRVDSGDNDIYYLAKTVDVPNSLHNPWIDDLIWNDDLIWSE